MKRFYKNKSFSWALAIFAFAFFAGFSFFASSNTVYASDYTDCSKADPTQTGGCYSDTGSWPNVTCKDCIENKCKSDPATDKPSIVCTWHGGLTNSILPQSAKNITTVQTNSEPDICGIGGYAPWNWIKCLLLNVLRFVGWLIAVGASLFAWAVDTNKLKAVLDSPTIWESWKIIRDLLNVAFILVLLYSAFCTILQIEKYSYKKILLNLVIMALLVNFSFPITRFIIDAANVLQYTVLKTFFAGQAGDMTSVFASITGSSGLSQIIIPGLSASYTQIIASIVFSFILAITFVAIGIMFVIRMIVLSILIIFSPLAFVATILPDTGTYSSKWWDNLFRYSFFGPLMVLMIYISTKILSATINADILSTGSSFSTIAQKNSFDQSVLVGMSKFSIPIILLWLGMGIAQSMSIAGAGAVMGGAQKFAKWAGRSLYKAPWWVTKQVATSTGIPGGMKQTWDRWNKKGFPGFLKNVPGFRGEDRTKEAEARWAQTFGDKNAVSEFNRKKVQGIRDDWKKQGGLPEQELKDIINGKIKKDKSTQQAAAIELADKHNFFGPDAWTNFSAAKDLLKDDKALDNAFDKEVKSKRIDLVMRYKVENKIEGATYKGELDKLGVSDFGKMSLEDLYKSSGDAKQAIHSYFDAAKPTRKLEISKNLNGRNQAFLEQSGILFETMEKAAKETKEKSDKFAEDFIKQGL